MDKVVATVNFDVRPGEMGSNHYTGGVSHPDHPLVEVMCDNPRQMHLFCCVQVPINRAVLPQWQGHSFLRPRGWGTVGRRNARLRI